MRLNSDIVSIPTRAGVLLVGIRPAFDSNNGLGIVLGEEEVRRHLLQALQEQTVLTDLRRFWWRWHSDAHRTEVKIDRSVIDRIAFMSERGPLRAYFIPHVSPVIANAPSATAVVRSNPAKASKQLLQSVDFDNAARSLSCEVASIRAVAETETKDAPFDHFGRPTILFERHKFHEYTGGKYDDIAADLSDERPGGYGPASEQYNRFDRACALDVEAAERATSWGMFQIMGFNYRQAGYTSVADFVTAMQQTVQEQLKAFVTFIQRDGPLHRALQRKDWTTFASLYNGKDYQRNHYDKHMRENYEKFAPKPAGKP